MAYLPSWKVWLVAWTFFPNILGISSSNMIPANFQFFRGLGIPATSSNIQQHPATPSNIQQHPATRKLIFSSKPPFLGHISQLAVVDCRCGLLPIAAVQERSALSNAHNNLGIAQKNAGRPALWCTLGHLLGPWGSGKESCILR